MKIVKKYWIPIGVVILVVVSIALSLFWLKAQSYQSDFQDEKNWTTYDGSTNTTLKRSKGALSMGMGLGSKLMNKHKELKDFQASVTVKVNGENGTSSGDINDSGLLFRVESDSLASGADVVKGYYFGIDLIKQEVFLKRGDVASAGWITIATKRMFIQEDTPYRLTVKVAGTHILGYVNEKSDSYPVLDVLDEDFSEGQIGIQNQQLEATFSDFEFKDYQEPEVKGKTYVNSLLPEIADPDVLYWQGMYYLYATTPGRNIGGIKVYTSKDLVNWEDAGLAMTAGTDNWGTNGFWAPDLIERDGKFYMYYTANEHLCVSVADSPLGPFIQDIVKPMHEETKEIDAHAFKDDDGQYYLYFVRFNDGNITYGAKLNDDMQTIDESSIVEVLHPSQPWELDMGNIYQ